MFTPGSVPDAWTLPPRGASTDSWGGGGGEERLTTFFLSANHALVLVTWQNMVNSVVYLTARMFLVALYMIKKPSFYIYRSNLHGNDWDVFQSTFSSSTILRCYCIYCVHLIHLWRKIRVNRLKEVMLIHVGPTCIYIYIGL